MRRLLFIVGLVGLASIAAWPVRADVICSSRYQQDGVYYGGSSENTFCTRTGTYVPGESVACQYVPGKIACCIKNNLPNCVNTTLENTAFGNLSESTGTAPTQPNLTFTPNVPIPGVFEGTKQVDSTLFARYIGAFFVYFIGVIGVLATVMVMWGGYHYIVSQGNPQRMKLGKETINNSIIGLALALTSFLLLSLVNPELVSFRGIVPEFVSGAFQPLERTTVPEKSGSTVVRGDYPTIAARVRQHPDWIAAIQGEASAQVPAERILAILFVESAGIENARSSANAYGLMQLLPSTAQQFGVSQADLFNGVKNIQGGARYLKSLYENTCPAETSKTKCTNGQPCRSATSGDAKYQFVNAAYNGGRAANHCSRDCPGQTWSQCTGNPGYAETRNYIIKAQDAYQWIVDNRFFSS